MSKPGAQEFLPLGSTKICPGKGYLKGCFGFFVFVLFLFDLAFFFSSHPNFLKGLSEVILLGMWAPALPSCFSHSEHQHVLFVSLLWASIELAKAVSIPRAVNLISEMPHGMPLGFFHRPQTQSPELHQALLPECWSQAFSGQWPQPPACPYCQTGYSLIPRKRMARE